MESQNRLGIYWSKSGATVVCLASQGGAGRLLDCFSVRVDDDAEQGPQLLADRIVQTCRERKIRFAEAAVALDCAAFMQHTVQSEFNDPKRIAATIRFDTEEALATDVSDVAVAFRIASTHDSGASLDVFTAQRATLSDLLLSLQSNGIDPVAVDPDVCCLSRYLLVHAKADETPEPSTLYTLLSDHRGYLLVVSGAHQATVLRTFLIGPAQDRNGLLARETLVTTALAGTVKPAGHLHVFDTKAEILMQPLAARTGLEVSECDLIGMGGIEPDSVSDCASAVDFALAYGAALALSEKANPVNFRSDHMPYQGRRQRLLKAVRFLSVSLTVLLLAVGVYFHSQLLVVNKARATLRTKKFEPDYRSVMLGEKKPPDTMKEAVGKLERALRLLKAEKTGVGASQDSISAKLTLVLQALNDCARQTDLNIDSVTIWANSIVINASTSSRQHFVSGVQEAMKKAGLRLTQESATSEAGRERFTITLQPAKQSGAN